MIVIDNVGSEPCKPSSLSHPRWFGVTDLWFGVTDRWFGVTDRFGFGASRLVLRAGWAALLCLLVLIYGSHAPLIALSQSDGRVPFSPSSCVLLIELAKLLVSGATLLLSERVSGVRGLSEGVSGGRGLSEGVSGVRWALVLPYAAPAMLYALNNNLVVTMQEHMDPSTFQLLSNLKIASTAAFYSCCLDKRLRPPQWLALGMLTLAGAAHTYSTLAAQSSSSPVLHISWWGLLLLLLYCSASGLAAVTTERVLKGQRLPLSLQNLFLYGWGVAINAAAHFLGGASSSSSSSEDSGRGFLTGFSGLVWLIVVGQVAAGLMMSVLMKHGSGITRLFVISSSLLVNSAISWLALGLQLTPLFMLPASLVALAAYLYYR
ncbi:probable UDP-sugar transporter protein SLC35A4 [Engraulis encrasicolus]|uniref:probable UDP-sugar transporter protein SLC35A4 n=1 Tax=Engraulis encrasicolus TaxID=184585 RepID=UPI002FD715F7